MRIWPQSPAEDISGTRTGVVPILGEHAVFIWGNFENSLVIYMMEEKAVLSGCRNLPVSYIDRASTMTLRY